VNLLVVGHGRMGRLIEQIAPDARCRIAGVVDEDSPAGTLESKDFGAVDVAIDFTVAAAVRANLAAMAARGWNVVIGTTGWQADEAECRAIVERTGIGVLASANFSIGMHVFRAVVSEAARRFGAVDDVGSWIHESHHAAKKDAPSGTALMLEKAMEEAGWPRGIDVSATRAGAIPGTHEIGFDSAAETVTLTHTVRDRAVFAHCAIAAAKGLKGRRGWYGMGDWLGR
jgi:4-hydroxy-tetrahydrodipicolinate reductase